MAKKGNGVGLYIRYKSIEHGHEGGRLVSIHFILYVRQNPTLHFPVVSDGQHHSIFMMMAKKGNGVGLYIQYKSIEHGHEGGRLVSIHLFYMSDKIQPFTSS